MADQVTPELFELLKVFSEKGLENLQKWGWAADNQGESYCYFLEFLPEVIVPFLNQNVDILKYLLNEKKLQSKDMRAILCRTNQANEYKICSVHNN